MHTYIYMYMQSFTHKHTCMVLEISQSWTQIWAEVCVLYPSIVEPK